MTSDVDRPAEALADGPLPARRAVWVVALLALLVGLVLAVGIPRFLTVPSSDIDCSIGSPTYSSEVCSDEPPQEEDLLPTGDGS